jgi:hypothetical protein
MVREKKKRGATTKQALPPNKEFYLFFIWQAIVRGRLFLQTAFLFSPDPGPGAKVGIAER